MEDVGGGGHVSDGKSWQAASGQSYTALIFLTTGGDLGGKVGEGGAGVSGGGHVAAQGGQGGGGLAQVAARLVHQQHLANGHSEGERERRE